MLQFFNTLDTTYQFSISVKWFNRGTQQFRLIAMSQRFEKFSVSTLD